MATNKKQATKAAEPDPAVEIPVLHISAESAYGLQAAIAVYRLAVDAGWPAELVRLLEEKVREFEFYEEAHR
jgi:hypothetical protein